MSLLLAALTFRDAGISHDEPACAEYGRHVMSWFRTGGADLHALHSWDWQYYGGLYEGLVAVAEKLSPLSAIDTRHLCNAITGLIGAWGAATLGTLVAGPMAGFWAAALLLTHPSWWGHLFANSKDIPFAAAHTWAIVGLLRLALATPQQRLRRSVLAGGLIGLALAVRAGGMFLFAELAAVLFALGWTGRRPSIRSALRTARLPLIMAVVAGWVVMIAGWPYGLTNPVTGPVTAALVASHFPNEVSFLWFGRMLTSTHLPWYYLPVSLIIRSPIAWLVLIPAGSWLMLHGRRLPVIILHVALLLPIALIELLRSALYDGIRHVLFLLPLLACLGGAALAGFVERMRARRSALRLAGALLVTFGCFIHALTLVELHPYEYVYLSPIVGGFRSAPGRFEVDDYGHAMREAWRRLAAFHAAGPHAARPGRVLVPLTGPALEADDLPALRRTMSRQDADYLLLPPPRPGATLPEFRLLFCVSRLGVPMLSAYDLRRSGAKILPVIPR